MSSTPYTLSAEQREQTLTQEISKRTSSGKSELLATRPFKAYVRTGSVLTGTWPLALAIQVLWVLAVVIIAFLALRATAVIVILGLVWWLPRVLTRVEVITIGERGEVSVKTLYWDCRTDR